MCGVGDVDDEYHGAHDELDVIESMFEQITTEIKRTKQVWLVDARDYDAVMDMLNEIGLAYNTTNLASCMLVILSIFERHIADLNEGWLDQYGQPARMGDNKKRRAPLVSVFGTTSIDDIAAINMMQAIKLARELAGGELSISDIISQIADFYVNNTEREQNGAS